METFTASFDDPSIARLGDLDYSNEHCLPAVTSPADGYFLNDNDPPTCKPCKALVVTSSLLVPAAMGITIVLLLAVALHPAGRDRVNTILRWFKFKSEDLLTLSGKLSVLFQTCQTVRAE